MPSQDLETHLSLIEKMAGIREKIEDRCPRETLQGVLIGITGFGLSFMYYQLVKAKHIDYIEQLRYCLFYASSYMVGSTGMVNCLLASLDRN